VTTAVAQLSTRLWEIYFK